MRVVIQRVSHASVTIEGVCKSAIKEGFMILVGIEEADTQEDADWLCKKIIGLRVFDDENGVMNKSIREVEGNILVISQFTLHASTKKGNRPSYIRAAKHDIAIPLYDYFCRELSIFLCISFFDTNQYHESFFYRRFAYTFYGNRGVAYSLNNYSHIYILYLLLENACRLPVLCPPTMVGGNIADLLA